MLEHRSCIVFYIWIAFIFGSANRDVKRSLRRTAQTFQELGPNDIHMMPNNLFDPRNHLDQISGPAK